MAFYGDEIYYGGMDMATRGCLVVMMVVMVIVVKVVSILSSSSKRLLVTMVGDGDGDGDCILFACPSCG